MVSRPNRQQGHALLVTLIMLVLVGMAAAVLISAVGLQLRMSRAETQRIQLVALSDAALAEALANLARNPAFSGSDKHEFGPGTIASRVQTLDVHTRWIEATAALPNGRALQAGAKVRILATGPVILSWERLPAGTP